MDNPNSTYSEKPCQICGRKKVRYGRKYCSGCDSRKLRGWKEDELLIPFSGRKQDQRHEPEFKTRSQEHAYDFEWEDFKRFIGIQRDRKAAIPKPPQGDLIRYGVISDLHIPFHDRIALFDSVDWLIDNKVDVLYVGGDILDLYSLSRFNQYESVPIQTEFQKTRVVLDYLSRSFHEVRLIEGNHEARERKYLSSRLEPNMLNFILTKSMLQRCAEDMPNVKVESQLVHGTRMGWLTQVGDAVIGHPEKSSKIPLRPVETFHEWLLNWHDEIGFSRPRLVIAGHTHAAGVAFVGHTMVVESGCLCLVQGYALQPCLYNKPQRTAATIFEQVSGVTDFNSFRQYYPKTTGRLT